MPGSFFINPLNWLSSLAVKVTILEGLMPEYLMNELTTSALFSTSSAGFSSFSSAMPINITLKGTDLR